MRIADSIRLAWRTFHGVRRIPAIITIAIGVVCMSLGAGIYREVNSEKGEPCEITATPIQGTISGAMKSLASQIEGVEDITYVWELPGTLQYEDYHSDVILYGIEPSYLVGEWLQGSVFTDNAAMPYLVLNEAAVKTFKNEKKVPLTDSESIRWDEEVVKLADETGTVVRICGVLDDGQDLPRAYLSIDQIKDLRMNSGLESSAETLWLRLTDSGVRGDVVRALSGISLAASSEDERETDWKLRVERSVLYMGTGCMLLICSFVLVAFAERLWKNEENDSIQALVLIGMPLRWLRRIACMRWILTLAIGVVLGRLVMVFM